MPVQLLQWTSVLIHLHIVKNNAHTLLLVENTCMWLFKVYVLFQSDISQDLCGSEQSWLFWTEQMLSQWKLPWIESERESRFVFFLSVFFFFFLRISSSWDEKKTLVISEWIHLSVFFSVNNATCRLHGCIGWVRHLWPSGDWELVFACRESRSKQARDRPRWSELDSACWARRQILSL